MRPGTTPHAIVFVMLCSFLSVILASSSGISFPYISNNEIFQISKTVFLLLIVVTYKRELRAKTGDNGQQIFYMKIARKAFVCREKDSKGQQKSDLATRSLLKSWSG